MQFVDGCIPNLDELQVLWRHQCQKMSMPMRDIQNSLAGLLWCLAIHFCQFGKHQSLQDLLQALLPGISARMLLWAEQAEETPAVQVNWRGLSLHFFCLVHFEIQKIKQGTFQE